MSRLVYFDTNVLQKDMRIRLPKALADNLDAEKGVTRFQIYYETSTGNIVLKKVEEEEHE